ncbi:phosphoserine phosphatase SerB [Nocardioides sp. TF02-7]|uniref:phosphoserine phosphatase SerB n=1 Tax=Nocardioides sp. TF02-7 TaxID=2917724 RepID=UPI0031F51ADC
MTATQDTLLITLTGKDRPGVTSAVFTALAQSGVSVIDVEQILLRRRLLLGVLVNAPRDPKKLRRAVEQVAAELEMSVEVETGTGDNRTRRAGRSHVTIIGAPLRASAMAAIAGRIADCGANIDRIERMARYPVTAIELDVSGADPLRLRTMLAREAAARNVDVAVQPASLLRHAVRLIVMDVDSTLIQGEVIEMLAAHAGFEAEVAAVTEAAMRGDIDFEESLRQRVRLLAGLDESVLGEVYDAIVVNPGARTMVRTLGRLGYRFAIVSGGFTQITNRLAADLGIHFSRANTLEIVDGRLTGELVGEVVDRAGKARALREFAARAGVPEAATIAIGDGANDLDMLEAAGLGIAYNARPVVREAADTAVNVPYLDAIMYLLGISREGDRGGGRRGGDRHARSPGLAPADVHQRQPAAAPAHPRPADGQVEDRHRAGGIALQQAGGGGRVAVTVVE